MNQFNVFVGEVCKASGGAATGSAGRPRKVLGTLASASWDAISGVRLGLPTGVMALWIAAAVIFLGPVEAGAQPPVRAAQVKVELDQAGVGGIVRPGSSCGLRLRLTDTANKQRDVIVRITLRDTDGDYPAYTRLVTLNPGAIQPVWVHLYLPYADLRGTSIVASVYATESGGGMEAVERGRLGELLGQTIIGGSGSPLNVADRQHVIFARVGPKLLGLDRYVTSWRGGMPPLAHEAIQLAEIRQPADFPDSWQALEPISAIVWGVGEPGELRGPYAKALREWVERGGHLVVVLPPAGQTWVGRTEHELSDIMPEVSAIRTDGEDMRSFAPLLSRAENPRMPRDATVYDLVPRPGVDSWKAQRILTSPDGRCVVARRLVAAGAVTLVGLDLARDSTMLDADVFWHRVMGTRGELFNAQELNASIGNRLARGRTVIEYDRFIAGGISKGQSAAGGVLFGIVAFSAYWLVAGFGSFGVLKHFKRLQHSWVAFALSAALFTAVAWGGAWMLKPKRVSAAHVTFFDSVYGQNRVRARSWMSLMIPFYGDARVALGGADGNLEAPGTRREYRSTVVPWDTPSETVGERAFPDTREYTIDVTNPGDVSFPVRSTVRQLRVDWTGGLLWNPPYPVTDAGDAGGALSVDDKGHLTGRLKHGLPGALQNVTVVYLPRQRRIGKPQPIEGNFPLVTNGWAGERGGTWEPGETFDLTAFAEKLRESALRDSSIEEVMGRLATSGNFVQLGGVGADIGSVADRVKALTFIGQLRPPFSREATTADRIATASRTATHGWDLSRWFTQPCVMVIGELVNSPLPAPLFVNGELVQKSEGSTWVRWIYPLPENPPAYDDALLPGGASSGSTPPDPTNAPAEGSK